MLCTPCLSDFSILHGGQNYVKAHVIKNCVLNSNEILANIKRTCLSRPAKRLQEGHFHSSAQVGTVYFNYQTII